jgi:hypothetical protein
MFDRRVPHYSGSALQFVSSNDGVVKGVVERGCARLSLLLNRMEGEQISIGILDAVDREKN